MKSGYENKMVKNTRNKEIAVYVGSFPVWIPKLNKKVNPGDKVPGFPIDEAKQREDFTIVKEY